MISEAGRCSGGEPLGAKGCRYSFRDAHSGRVTATLEIDHIRADSRSIGFLKISVLKIVVLDGVRLRIWDLDRWPGLVKDIERRFTSFAEGTKAVQLQNFELYLRGDRQPRVVARSGTLKSNAVLELVKAQVAQCQLHRKYRLPLCTLDKVFSSPPSEKAQIDHSDITSLSPSIRP
jgi:hypothetical protein